MAGSPSLCYIIYKQIQEKGKKMIPYYRYWTYSDLESYIFDLMVNDIQDLINANAPWGDVSTALSIYKIYVRLCAGSYYFFYEHKHFAFPIF